MLPLSLLRSENCTLRNFSIDFETPHIAQVVANRAAQGNNFGTVLIPEGLIEFIPAMKLSLIHILLPKKPRMALITRALSFTP